ncbi:MAG: VWA domain-containing protein [Thiohalocapsa sp.]
MWQDFHFLSPLHFLLLPPLGLLLWAAVKRGSETNAWRRVIDARLLAVLVVDGKAGVQRWWPLALLGAGWVIAVTALANPTFERQPIPAFRGDAARVVVMDLSQSMLADDLTPTRIARARYKVADILARSEDGQSGLIVFAGDAFSVSPLTDDAETILAMLGALSPDIMPVQGSRPDLAILRALDLLRQAGAYRGEVVLLTDDAGDKRALAAAEDLRAAGHRLAVIGVGTPAGAAVPGVRTSQGDVIAKVDPAVLSELANAGGGAYASLTSGDADLNLVMSDRSTASRALQPDDSMLTESWKELGPWVALALLPLGALAFRRGWVLGVTLLGAHLTMLSSEPATAGAWEDLWQRRDQQAARALGNGEFERALELGSDPLRAGAASYRLGDYAAAAEAFASGDSPDHYYNRGNALAQSGQYDEAIAAYDEALARAPDMADAMHNKRQIEQLKQQQEQQSQDQGGPDSEQQDGSEQNQSGAQEADQQDPDENAQNGHQKPEEQSGQGESGQEENAQDRADDGSGQQPERSDTDPRQANADPGEREESDAESPAPPQDKRPGAADRNASSNESDDGRSGPEETDRARDEQAAANYREEAATQAGVETDLTRPEGDPAADVSGGADEPTPEDLESRQAANQWLRRIPDDPAGLLRRKFLYQYRARAEQQGDVATGNPW